MKSHEYLSFVLQLWVTAGSYSSSFAYLRYPLHCICLGMVYKDNQVVFLHIIQIKSCFFLTYAILDGQVHSLSFHFIRSQSMCFDRVFPFCLLNGGDALDRHGPIINFPTAICSGVFLDSSELKRWPAQNSSATTLGLTWWTGG